MNLNERALEICRRMVDAADALKIGASKTASGALLIDCGVHTPGGLEAGRLLAEASLAGLGQVSFVPLGGAGAALGVQVATDQPVAACLASQYAGWEVRGGAYFAMGSGPMRAAANREPLFERIGHAEHAAAAVGVLETSSLPPSAVVEKLADACGVSPRDLVLLAAPTRSLAGMVQIVARSVETTMHKLVELEFDVDRVESAWGTAPLPPPASDDLTALGRTNDAILYGAEVTLWVRGDDASLREIGPQTPSDAAPDYGRPFAEIFAAYDRDFYKIDKRLFSPAVVTFCNLETGRRCRFGRLNAEVLERSFGAAE